MPPQLVSFLGLAVIISCTWAISRNRRVFPWRTVAWGLGLQCAFALLILKTSAGVAIFEAAREATGKISEFATEGGKMVFGSLADPAFLGEKWGPNQAFILAITVTTTIVVVSALSSLLYHWGILQRIVRAVALVMQKSMRTSGSETLAAAANIFMGQTEAPLLVRPYLRTMTQSELLAMMTGGMATIAGSVLIVYVSFGAIPGHLLTASVMSAPAALMIAKILLPETEISETANHAPLVIEKTATNGIDALCQGASDGMRLSINVIAMLIAFVALIAMANSLLQLILSPFSIELTLQQLVGWINAPFAWLIGVPAKDCSLVGQMLGERIVLNEFFGYRTLTQNWDLLDERSRTLATYALCGFANFGSVAIQIGGIGVLVPERRTDLARLGLLSMVGGLLTCYTTAAMVGILL